MKAGKDTGFKDTLNESDAPDLMDIVHDCWDQILYTPKRTRKRAAHMLRRVHILTMQTYSR